ncbi:MAG: YceI family protein, partial [Chloroflexi bacterium]|nr:YceI family protein [Chloroflexota bacterium]
LAACGSAATPEPTATPSLTPAPPTGLVVTATPSAPVSKPPPTQTSPPTPDAAPRQAGDYAGIEFTFTVGEELTTLPLPNDAVLRTTSLSGDVSLDGGVSTITVDLHSLRSDQTFRDRYVQRTMFPNHRFATLTIPTVLPLPDGFVDGDEASAEVAGTLNVKRVDVPVTFDVVARDDGHSVFILAKTTVTWDQLQMPAPTARSVVSIEDDVKVEVLLAVRP